jgi:transposase InsO family protein
MARVVLGDQPAVGDWIERLYNRRRRHSAMGMNSPVDYENRLTQTAQAAWPCVHQTG